MSRLKYFISNKKHLTECFKQICFNTYFVICFSIFITDILVLEYTNYTVVDLIECSESEKEEVEETDTTDYLYFADLSSKRFIEQNIQFNSSDILLFRLYLDVFTPPPETPSC